MRIFYIAKFIRDAEFFVYWGMELWIGYESKYIDMVCVIGFDRVRRQASAKNRFFGYIGGKILTYGNGKAYRPHLYPDVHPNKPGRYRYFKEITIGDNREKSLLMAEFRLED